MDEPKEEVKEATQGEMSGVAVDGHRTLLKIGIIALFAAGVIAFGMMETKILPGLRKQTRTIPRNAPELEEDYPLPEGDLLMASEVVDFNGARGFHLRCVSRRSPGEVVRLFAEDLRTRGYQEAPRTQGRFPQASKTFAAKVRGKGYAMLGWRDEDGRSVGVTAFLNPNSLGSDYFVSRSEGPASDEPSLGGDGDVPGRDIEGVVRPPAATREFCMEKRGARPSMIVMYESSATQDEIRDAYQSGMPSLRWEQPVGSREVLSEHADGALFSFRREKEYCLVSIVDNGDWRSVTLVYKPR